MSDPSHDRLFRHIEALQGSRPWGAFLDAGTGAHSLGWIFGLETRRLTAVTGDPERARKLETRFAGKLRPADRIVAGNWNDPIFLHDEVYETVLADYLLGALEGFSPYFQDRLFARLRPQVGGRLYAVGLAPYLETDEPWGKLILEIARLRDACILLAGHRTYREYPLDWVIRSLESNGYVVEEAESFPIRYGKPFIEEQLALARRKLAFIRSPELARSLGQEIDRLEQRAKEQLQALGSTPYGEDWVVAARPG